jgi:hypothetical protein
VAFATYQDDQGIGRLGAGAGFGGYTATDLSVANLAPTVDVNDASSRTMTRINTTTTDATRVVNSIRMANANDPQTITLGTGGRSVALNIASGGLLTDTTQAVTINSGEIASSLSSGASHLYSWVIGGTTTLNTPIVGNTGLVKSGAGALTLSPSARVSSVLGTFAQTISTSTGSSTLSVSNTGGTLFYVGMPVSGSGIPVGTTINAISGNTLTLSSAVTATGTNVAVTFGTSSTVRAGTQGMIVGMPISGTDVPAGATVAAILGPNHYQLSSPATANSTQTLTYSSISSAPVSGTVGTISRSLNTTAGGNTIAVADGAEFEDEAEEEEEAEQDESACDDGGASGGIHVSGRALGDYSSSSQWPSTNWRTRGSVEEKSWSGEPSKWMRPSRK